MKRLFLFILICSLLILTSCEKNKEPINYSPEDSEYYADEIVGQFTCVESSMNFMSIRFIPILWNRCGYKYKMELVKAVYDSSKDKIALTFSITGDEPWINEDGYTKIGKASSIMISGINDNVDLGEEPFILLPADEYRGKGTADNPLVFTVDYYIKDSVIDTGTECIQQIVASISYKVDESKEIWEYRDHFFMAGGEFRIRVDRNIITKKEYPEYIYGDTSPSVEEVKEYLKKKYPNYDWVD